MSPDERSLQRYTVPVTEPTGNTTACLRASTHPNELVASLQDEDVATCRDLFLCGLSKNGGTNACLGKRPKRGDGSFGPFEWITYTEVEEKARAVGSALLTPLRELSASCGVGDCGVEEDEEPCPIQQYPEEQYPEGRELRVMGLFSKNRVEWYIGEQAANMFNFAVVPLYETLGLDALLHILKQTRLRCVMASLDCAKKLLALFQEKKEKPLLRLVVVFDELTEEVLKIAESLEIRMIHWDKLIEAGSKLLKNPSHPSMRDVNCLCYTSGTSGQPKGVIVTHANVVSTIFSFIRGPASQANFEFTTDDAHISYLPCAHILERTFDNFFLLLGARIGCYSGDVSQLLSDIQAMRPTFILGVPRVFLRINDKITAEVNKKPEALQAVFNYALKSKIETMRRTGCVTHPFWDNTIFRRTRRLLGGRVRAILTAGAPLDPFVQERLRVILCVPMVEGYGMTEFMAFIAQPTDPTVGHVGGPLSSVEFCLKSVQDMEYLVTDNPQRGEVCVRGPGVTVGYFCNKTETESAIDEDNWLHTGDVGELTALGSLKIIDRKKNMFKLAQGEYVAPERVEGVYQQAQLVSQVFVYGYTVKTSVVGIVIPDQEAAIAWAAANGTKNATLQELCREKAFKQAIEKEMEATAKKFGLFGFQKIKAFHLHPEAFSEENDLVTPTFKLKRHRLYNYFKDEIDVLYKSIE